MKKEEQEKYFKKYLVNLHHECQRLTSYIKLYRHLHERQADRLDEMNLAPAFFQTILSSLFTSLIIWTHNLFDEKSDKGFVNFLNFIKDHIKLFEISELQRRKKYKNGHWMLNRTPITLKIINAHKRKIKGVETFESIKTRRDKFHAHFDKKYFNNRDRIEKDAPLKWKELDIIVELMDDILNTYSKAFDGETYALGVLNIFDIDKILDILKKHNENIKV